MPSWHKEYIELAFCSVLTWLLYKLWVVMQPTSPLVKGRKRGDYQYIELFFAVCWVGYFICFWVVIQHTSPLVKGRKREDYLCRTVIRNALSYFFCSVLSWLLYMLLSSYAAHLSPCKGKKARGLPMPNWDKECIELAFAVCWVGYFISFCVVMQHTSPLGKGRWRGDCWYQTLCTIYI